MDGNWQWHGYGYLNKKNTIADAASHAVLFISCTISPFLLISNFDIDPKSQMYK
jgi:hypothetical protein